VTRRRTSRRVLSFGISVVLGISLAVVAGPANAVRGWSRGVDSWVTDLATSQRLDPAPRIRWRGGAGEPGATIVVDPTRRYQKMVGFGASMTDSSAYV